MLIGVFLVNVPVVDVSAHYADAAPTGYTRDSKICQPFCKHYRPNSAA